MAETDEVAAILDVFRVDPANGAETAVGSLELFESGRLAVLEVEPDSVAKLTEAVASINGKAQIVEIVPPANATGAGQTGSRVTQRGDPDFVQAVNRFLRTYYGFSLG